MSHFTRIKTQFRDGDLLARCLEDSGYAVERGGTIRGYQGERRVDLSVRLPAGYGFGFVRAPEGHYELLADWWGVRGVSQTRLEQELTKAEAEVRKAMEEAERRVRQQYALETTLRQLQREGYKVVEQITDQGGRVKLLARRWR